MLWRIRIVWRSVRRFGIRATWVALGARAHGAIQKIGEFAALSRLVSERQPAVVLEIGSREGGSYWAWCRLATPTATLVSIDFPGTDEWTARLRGYPREHQTQRLIRADSHDPNTLEAVRDLEGAVDLLFIDGDHGYDGVRADFETYAPLVKPGGLIAFHDVVPHLDPTCQVDRLWNQLRDVYETREFVDSDYDVQGGWAGIGVIFWAGAGDLASWPPGGKDATPPAG
jgi:predicted O-methyltransferase YrrM